MSGTISWALTKPKDAGDGIADDFEGDDGKKSNKRLSVERIYQKKTQLEHILLRPDSYIGSVESHTEEMWIYDSEQEKMVLKSITYVPGLYKIFDEILVNAADNKQRDPKMDTIKIDIEQDKNQIRVWNNGKGIPVIKHKTEGVFVPSLIFGHLLTSSNYDDTEKKVTGGRNGYGAKLCNIFSTKFTVETSCSEYKKAFKQTWTSNMGKAGEMKLKEAAKSDFTCITFQPDLQKFKMESLDDDTVALLTRRAWDVAAATRGVKVYLNGKRLPISNFKDYVALYTKDRFDDMDNPLKITHEIVNPRWEVAVATSDNGFKQMSFVNSIATTKGGRHVDYVADQLITKLIETVKKKNKSGVIVRPQQVRNHLWVFVNCLIENPTFDSQTKENMTLQAKSFGSKCQVSDKFVTQMMKSGIIENILSWMRAKAQQQLQGKGSKAKRVKLKGIPKLDDANDAGSKNSLDCTLILTEGDSAKTVAVAGLGVVGRDRYGVFPLKGKLLNVREASHSQIMDNSEISNICKIVGLQYKQKYTDPEQFKTLRYGKIMIMTDQDQDGSHIKGLLINFLHHFWPNLLKQSFVEQFITPIVKVTKGNQTKSFFSLPEFEEWKRGTDGWHTWKVKYYKGLGTSSSKEAKEYFSDMRRHRINFKYSGTEDDSNIELAFSKKKVEDRKEWLLNWMGERRERAELGLPENFIYSREMKSLTFTDFVNKELILFSNMDNERSIPSMVDGLKPGQRKVLFTCLKRNLVKELKVAQLAGSVAEMSAYHHGENSLNGTIVNLAQDFVGSNNLNLLEPHGQFGTRLHGGKDSASPRYIFTCLSPLTRTVFNPLDEPMLPPNFDDNQRIEPVWYCPIIPLILCNGTDGIGTGWSTKIPNFDVESVINNLRRLLRGEELLEMEPSYRGFRGEISKVAPQRYACSGEVAILQDGSVEISELPVRTWTQTYKENVMDVFLNGKEKVKPCIQDYKEYHTDTTVRFVVKMTPEQLAAAEAVGLHKFFKLQTAINTSCMTLFDAAGCIKVYKDVEEIMKEFFDLRLERYRMRKEYLEGMLAAESLRLDNQARFICEKIEGKISIENKPKKELIKMLVRGGYDSDPVKAWKKAQNRLNELDNSSDLEDEDEEDDADFNYILKMELWSLTKERKDQLLKQRDAKAEELRTVRRKTPGDLWGEDLDTLEESMKKLEAKEKEETNKVNAGGRGKKGVSRDTLPSTHGRRVDVVIDTAMKKSAATRKVESTKAREAKAAKKLKLENEENGDDAEKPLSERIKASPNGKAPAKRKAPAKPMEPKAKKQQTLDSLLRKKTGKKPWQVSDSEGSDGEFQFSQDSPTKDRPRRSGGGKKAKYNFDSDSEEEDDEMIDNPGVEQSKPTVISDSEDDVRSASPPSTKEDSDSEDLFDPPPAILQKKSAAAKKPAAKSTVAKKPAEKKAAPAKKAPAKKAAAPKKSPVKKKPVKVDSESEDNISEASSPPPPLRERLGRGGPKKNYALDSDDEEDEIIPVSRKRKISESEDDFSFNDSGSDDSFVPTKKTSRKPKK